MRGRGFQVVLVVTGDGILARFKNFDFRGTIGGSQKSGRSEYTNRAQLGNCLFWAIGQVAIDSTKISSGTSA
jgi:hypothetical protein